MWFELLIAVAALLLLAGSAIFVAWLFGTDSGSVALMVGIAAAVIFGLWWALG